MRKMTLGPQGLGLASDPCTVLLGQLFPYPPPKGHPGQSLSLGLIWDLSICTCAVSQWLAGPCLSP